MTSRASAMLTGIALASAALFTLYLHQSRSVGVGSDGGSIALQAWDMLHGNLLLHGWAMSDVSFYPTELPQYVLLEWLRGLSPGVVHLAGAMTYTIVLLLAALVAKGKATGREAAARVLIAAGIMLAPAAGAGTSTLLLTPDHLGSTVPVLLAWLAADRYAPRWYVPVALGSLLAWGVLADALVEITGVLPVVLVSVIRFAQRRHQRAPAPWWYEPSLAAAAFAAVGAAALISAFIRACGGFALRPVGTRSAPPAALPHNAFLTLQGIGVLFGASFGRGQPVNLVISSLHLAGLALVAVAFCAALGRFRRRDERLVPALVLAIVLNVLLYVRGNYVKDVLSSREITGVLPFGAVLAGRVLAGPVRRIRLRGRNVLAPALALVLAGYAAGLVLYAARPPVPAKNQDLAGWLAGHHLTGGLAPSYWLANIVTADSGDRVQVRQVSVRPRGLAPPGGWGFAVRWYDPVTHRADFVVTNAPAGTRAWRALLNSARSTFGRPVRTYAYRQYTVLVWDQNLLARLG